MKHLYKTLQVKIQLHWTYIIISLWIVNIFLYNIALCADVPNTVLEWVTKYDTLDIKPPVPKSFEEWRVKHGLTSPTESWYPIKVRYEYIFDNPKDPALHNVPPSLSVNQVDNNATPSDSTFNLDHPMLSEQLTLKRCRFIDEMNTRTLFILQRINPTLSLDQLDNNSIKKVLHYILETYGKQSEWLFQTVDDVKDPYHEMNLRTQIIQNLISKNKLHIIEYKILVNLATLMMLMNSYHLEQKDNDALTKIINSEFYDQLYNKFINDENV